MENSPELPGNPYPATKRAVEDMPLSFRDSRGLGSIRVGYFDVAGAGPDCGIGGHHRPETNLIPSVLEAITDEDGQVEVFGTDCPTPDGSCIRDHMQVSDLVDAHVLGLKLPPHTNDSQLHDLEASRFHSAREVFRMCREVAARDVPAKGPGRRPVRSSVQPARPDSATWEPVTNSLIFLFGTCLKSRRPSGKDTDALPIGKFRESPNSNFRLTSV